jgi:hypothetical protein
MAYNLSGIGENTTGMLSFTQGVNNNLMFGFLGILLLVVISVICYIAFLASTDDAGKSFAATAFIATMLSILLRAVDLIPNLALIICVITLALTLAFMRGR